VHDVLVKTAELVPLARAGGGAHTLRGMWASMHFGEGHADPLPPCRTSTPHPPPPPHRMQAELPEDAGEGAGAPCSVSLSPNTGHAAVCWPGGAMAVFEVLLPESYYVVGGCQSIDILDHT
jgi:hypothetical protein